MKSSEPQLSRSAVAHVRLQLDRQKVCQLIRAGHLCATDFSCLDCPSRDALKRIFLQCSMRE